MVLTDDDKNHVRAIWAEVHGHEEEIGAEALIRMFTAHRTTKVYFSHFDLSPNSADIKAHGKKVMAALTAAVNHLDNMACALSKLSDLHAQELRVDPVNFNLLNHCIIVTLAVHHPGHLKPSSIVSLEKFLVCVAKCLTSKYR